MTWKPEWEVCCRLGGETPWIAVEGDQSEYRAVAYQLAQYRISQYPEHQYGIRRIGTEDVNRVHRRGS